VEINHRLGKPIMATLTEQLREMIQDYGTVYAVARDTGINQSVLQRFVTEQRDIYMSTADKLAEFFEVHLTKARRKRPKK